MSPAASTFALEMEAVGCSEMLTPNCMTSHTRRLTWTVHNPTDTWCHHVQNLPALETDLCNACSFKCKAQQMVAQFTSQSKLLLTKTSQVTLNHASTIDLWHPTYCHMTYSAAHEVLTHCWQWIETMLFTGTPWNVMTAHSNFCKYL